MSRSPITRLALLIKGFSFVTRSELHKQQGIALISVLLIIALIAGAIAAMMSTQHRTLRNTKVTVEHQQALQHLYSIETWVTAILNEDSTDIDDLSEDWAMELPPIPVPNGLLQGKLVDLQATINLNSLYKINPETKLVTTNNGHIQIANRLSQNLSLIGLGDAVFGLASTQLTEATLFKHPQILLQNQVYEREDYLALLPFISVLPESTSININTASKQVLMSLHPTMDEYTANSLIDIRQDTPFKTLDEFYQALHQRMIYLPLERLKKDIPSQLINIRTEYFMLESSIRFGDSQLIGQSVFQRKDKHVSLLSRQFYHP